MAQFFIGRKTLVGDIYPAANKTNAEFVATLQENIWKRGAMDKLISDRAREECGMAAQAVLQDYAIDDWQSEPYHQHQNFAENYWGKIKSCTNLNMERSGCPATMWLYCIMWVIFILNHCACAQLHWRTPIEALTGSTPDISAILQFPVWHPVYY